MLIMSQTDDEACSEMLLSYRGFTVTALDAPLTFVRSLYSFLFLSPCLPPFLSLSHSFFLLFILSSFLPFSFPSFLYSFLNSIIVIIIIIVVFVAAAVAVAVVDESCIS